METPYPARRLTQHAVASRLRRSSRDHLPHGVQRTALRDAIAAIVVTTTAEVQYRQYWRYFKSTFVGNNNKCTVEQRATQGNLLKGRPVRRDGEHGALLMAVFAELRGTGTEPGTGPRYSRAATGWIQGRDGERQAATRMVIGGPPDDRGV